MTKPKVEKVEELKLQIEELEERIAPGLVTAANAGGAGGLGTAADPGEAGEALVTAAGRGEAGG